MAVDSPTFRESRDPQQCAMSIADESAAAAADRCWEAVLVEADRYLRQSRAEAGRSPMAAAEFYRRFGAEQRSMDKTCQNFHQSGASAIRFQGERERLHSPSGRCPALARRALLPSADLDAIQTICPRGLRLFRRGDSYRTWCVLAPCKDVYESLLVSVSVIAISDHFVLGRFPASFTLRNPKSAQFWLFTAESHNKVNR